MNNSDTEMHDGRRERLRQRVQRGGLEALKPHEILELLLSFALPRQDTGVLARAMLKHFGDLHAALMAKEWELCQVEGMGEQTAQWICELRETALLADDLRGEPARSLANYAQTFRCALQLKQRLQAPMSMQLLLDMNSRLMFRSFLARSIRWGDPEVLRHGLSDVLSCGAKGVIVLLYPDGAFPWPEAYDIDRAKAYAFTLHAAGSELLDVLFIGEDRIISLRQLGHIPNHSKSRLLRGMREDYMRGMPGAKEVSHERPDPD